MLLTRDPPSFLQTILSCEFFTVSPGDWYGLASSSTCVCFFKFFLIQCIFLTFFFLKTFLKAGISPIKQIERESMLALPLWLTMQYVGKDQLIHIISKARVLVNFILFFCCFEVFFKNCFFFFSIG